MKDRKKRVAGLLLFVGGVECVLGIIVSEALYPGYSTSQNYISDLGVGPSALVFNSSVFLLGLLGIVSSYLIQRSLHSRVLPTLLVLASIGALGVGLFTEDFRLAHAVSSFIVFAFGGLSAIASYKFEKSPLSYVSVVLGVVTLVSIVLFETGVDLGLGVGGMERMVAYPALLWLVGFGAHLIGDSGPGGQAT